MCVVSHDYGEFGESSKGSGGWHALGTKPKALAACREMPVHIQSAK